MFCSAPQRITVSVVGNSLFQSWIKTIFSSLFYLFLIQPIVLEGKKPYSMGVLLLWKEETACAWCIRTGQDQNIRETMMKWKCLLVLRTLCWEIKSKLKTREDLVLKEIELLIKSFSFILFYQLYPFLLSSPNLYHLLVLDGKAWTSFSSLVFNVHGSCVVWGCESVCFPVDGPFVRI